HLGGSAQWYALAENPRLRANAREARPSFQTQACGESEFFAFHLFGGTPLSVILGMNMAVQLQRRPFHPDHANAAAGYIPGNEKLAAFPPSESSGRRSLSHPTRGKCFVMNRVGTQVILTRHHALCIFCGQCRLTIPGVLIASRTTHFKFSRPPGICFAAKVAGIFYGLRT